MQIEVIPIDRLIPYARNSRTHSDAQVAQIAASIKEFGFTNPVLIDGEGGIIAGHGRVMGARQLGLADVPCIRLGHLTEHQRRAYVIADNKLALNAGWNDEMLALELRELMDAGYDVGLTGFDLPDIDELLADMDATKEGKTDPDDTPPVQAEAVTKTGDVWLLGKHRIMCGDSTSADQVRKLLGGGVPHLMVTDPPYGIEYDADWRNNALRSDGTPVGGRATGKVLNDDRADWSAAWALFPGDVAYIWHASSYTDVVAGSLRSCGFEMRSLIIWAKSVMVIGRGHYHPQHEPCWYVVKKGKTANWTGGRKQKTLWRFVPDQIRGDEIVYVRKEQADVLYALTGDESTVWEIPKPQKSETGHSTQKPVECMARPIRNNSKPGDSVYEPFSGSGTTIIAAEQTGRRCYAMELSPNYVDVAVRRWQQFTGKRATLESTGAEFPG